jgi:mono/diheme cytochrome c family protein
VIIIIFIVNVLTHGSIQHPGKSSYQTKCADCHGENGEGIKTLVPPLMSSDFAKQNFDSLPCWLKNGMNKSITVNGIKYDQPMYGLEMDAIQIANVMNYLSKEMLGADKEINSLQVKKRLKECK